MSTEAEVVEVIVAGSRVKMHFALRLDTGETVDSTFDREPAELTVGDGNLPEGFEKNLIGLEAGAHQTFSIAPADGFGQYNPSNTQVISHVRKIKRWEIPAGFVMDQNKINHMSKYSPIPKIAKSATKYQGQ